MDEVLLRFPVVGQKVFEKLDYMSLAKCRNLSKFCKTFLDNDSLVWRRKIKRYTKNQVKFNKHWKLATTKISIDFMKNLTSAVEEFFSRHQSWRKDQKYQCSPLHIAAELGHLDIIEYISGRCHLRFFSNLAHQTTQYLNLTDSFSGDKKFF